MTGVAAGDVLDAALQALDGATVTLRERLGPGALVVVFLRHYG